MNRIFHSQVVSISDVPLNDVEQLDEDSQIDILVVDDETIIADTLATILSRSGYTARSTYDGKSALALAQALRPSLVISDVVMPGMTGIELALTLESLLPKCKVLLFSGQAATVDLLAKAREMGREFTILNKPIHPTDMLRRVSQYVKPERTSCETATA